MWGKIKVFEGKEGKDREREERAPAIWCALQPELPNKVWGFERAQNCAKCPV